MSSSDVLKPPGRSDPTIQGLGSGITWETHGLPYAMGPTSQRRNLLWAAILNRLASNRWPAERTDPFCFEAIGSSAELIGWFERRGWSCRGRFRASVASFGLGASRMDGDGWVQILMAVTYRTGLLTAEGAEQLSLLPHCSFELELTPLDDQDRPVLVQHYQGTEGLNGWAALNELHRPWQNDRFNGTVNYPGEPITGGVLHDAMAMSEVMAAIHNAEASADHLSMGGYGSLGFCIDSTALLQLSTGGRCDFFPLTVSGLWRERLQMQRRRLLKRGLHDPEGLNERYALALESLPLDTAIVSGDQRLEASYRLRRSLPRHTPFQVLRELNGEEPY